MTSNAVADLSLAALSAAIRRRDLSCTEATDAALARANAIQPHHNAFVEVMADRARAQAAELDTELSAGHWRGPLHGVPLAHKDCLEREGAAMSVGSAVLADAPKGQRDATVLARLRTAGAIDIGRLHLNEMVAGPTGGNPYLGDCANAHDPSRISGGSSSGSGVAVSLGACFGAIGSDTGGSIRLPAAMNGIVGLKPTWGRISRAGCFPRAASLDCAGPMARSAEDCALMLAALAGIDPHDPTTSDLPVPDYVAALDQGAEGSRLAVLDEAGTLDPDVEAAFQRFLGIAATGFAMVAPRRWGRLDLCYAMGDVVSKVEAATMHGRWMAETPERYSQAVYARTEPGLHLPATRYLETLSLRGRILEDFLDTAFHNVDVLLIPTCPVAVPTREDADMEAGERVFPVVASLTRLTRPFSFLGLPVLSIPIGIDRNAMPVGAQLVGRPFAEARLLALGHRLKAMLTVDAAGGVAAA